MISVTASSCSTIFCFLILSCTILLVVSLSTLSCTYITNIHVMHPCVFTLSPNYLFLSLLQYNSFFAFASFASLGEAVTDMVTVASDLFHVVNGAFTMKKMCEQSMNQSLHDGSVEGEHCHRVLYIPCDYYTSCTLMAFSLYALPSSSSLRVLSILSFISISIDRLITFTLRILPISYFLLS